MFNFDTAYIVKWLAICATVVYVADLVATKVT